MKSANTLSVGHGVLRARRYGSSAPSSSVVTSGVPSEKVLADFTNDEKVTRIKYGVSLETVSSKSTGCCHDVIGLDLDLGEIEELFYVGWRGGVLHKVVTGLKYESVWAAADVLAELMDRVIPKELQGVTVVPLPTTGRHIRQRGLDHTAMLARKLTKRRKDAGWKVEKMLARRADTVQVGQKAAMREKQAERAYESAPGAKIEPERTYLLLDDVWTTGATMRAAAKVMREMGAEKILGVVIEVGRPKAEDEV